MTKSRLLPVIMTALTLSLSSVYAEDKLRALIIDGQNNHDWKATTPALKAILEDCGRFVVDVTTTPASAPAAPKLAKDATSHQQASHQSEMAEWKAKRAAFEQTNVVAWGQWLPDFTKYDVVVMNYNGTRWPDDVRSRFVQYVKGGGGLVIFHAANNSFPDWPEYNEMIGVGGWGGRNEKSGPMIRWRAGTVVRDETPGPGGTHGPAHEFVVEIRNSEHPITKGLPVRWRHAVDELYSKLRGPANNLTVLATAFADPSMKGTGEHEPLLMTVTYGKGRVFHDALGHGPKSMVDVGFINTLQRGAEWAATGTVTLPAPPPESFSTERVITRGAEEKRATVERARAGTSRADKPNIIVVLTDDVGYGDIGPFGSKLNRTPNLDRMATQGMKLTNFYCAPVCSASRAQLLTGSYAKRVSVGLYFPASATGMNPQDHTIAELLKPQGYATMIVGKWHLGDQPEFLPTRQGFDHFFGLPYSNDMGERKPPAQYRPPLPLVRDEKVIEAPPDQDELTRRFTDESINFIKTNRERPFFLYLAHIGTHVPLHAGPAFKGKSENGSYGDWVEELDWSVGRLLATLEELDLDRNTLVVFTSDNGPWLSKGKNGGTAGPLRGGKFTTWEGGVRTPTIAWWPGRIPAGTVCEAALGEIDLLPTVAGLAGAKVAADRVLDGKDIWPVLSGRSKQSPHAALYYFGGDKLEAVRSGPWKIAIAPQGEGPDGDPRRVAATREQPRLYNLDDDEAETTDVAAKYPEVVRSFQPMIDAMDKDLGISGKGPGVRPAGRVDAPKPLQLSPGD